jgi:hypothetical protein
MEKVGPFLKNTPSWSPAFASYIMVTLRSLHSFENIPQHVNVTICPVYEVGTLELSTDKDYVPTQ